MAETTNDKPEPKVCESCGETFGCGAMLDGCWCVDIKISAELGADLKTKFNDCLCMKCLQAEDRGGREENGYESKRVV